MPEKQKEHVRGVGPKEQREYEHIKEGSSAARGPLRRPRQRSGGAHGNEGA